MSEQEKDRKPDVEINSSFQFKKMEVKSSGKSKVRFTSNLKTRKLHHKTRINVPQELKDGETYTDGEMHSRIENYIQDDQKNCP